MSDDLIASLQAAVERAPSERALRRHLSELLVAAHRPGEALPHLEHLLHADPADAAALRLAATAASALGDPRAEGWRRLAAALDAGPAASDPSVGGEVAGDDSDPPLPDSVEDLIDLWGDDAPHEPEIGQLTTPRIGFDDVGGMGDIKARLTSSFLAPMRNPDLAAAFSKSLRGGLLLWGPPGCGKTFLARALAGELGASFYSIGLSDVLDMFFGNSERNLASIFDTARRNTPCLLFFDEMDALGQKRTHLRGSGSGMRTVVNQFLTELDGVGKDNDGLFVLGATNHPWDVDAALLRPGRFDRMMLVLPPDREARRSILEYHMRGRPQSGLDLDRIASRTDGFTGADLALLCESATERAMTSSLEQGRIEPVGMSEFKKSLREVKPSVGPWFETARNYALYSNEGGTFDELLRYLKR